MFYPFKQMLQKINPRLRQIVSNMGWLLAERILNILLAFLGGILVIRYLGAEDFGKLSYCTSLVALVTVIPQLGLNNIVVRNLVQIENATSAILGTAFILKLLASLIVVVVFNIAIGHIYGQSDIYWLILILTISLLFTPFETIEFWFQSQVISRPVAFVRSLQMILSFLAKLILILFQFPLIAFAGLILAESIFKSLGNIVVYLKHHQSLGQWKIDWQLGKKMLQDAYPLIFSGIMVIIYMKIDQVMLGNMTNPQETGNYAAAVRFSEIFYFIPVIICSSVFPTILRVRQTQPQKYYHRLQQLYDMIAWLALIISLPMALISVPLMQTLLGPEYHEAGHILAWHIWASLFVFLGVARGQWLMAENYTHFSFLTTSLGAIVNVSLNYVLIPIYGGQGAAIATVISYGVASYLSCLFYPRIYQTGWMLTKALLIPIRMRQNQIYLSSLRELFRSSLS